jgi:hypothetical protein
MAHWRAVLGVDEEDFDFDSAHMRYRERALSLPMPVTLDDLRSLNRALDDAKKECDGFRQKKQQKRA